MLNILKRKSNVIYQNNLILREEIKNARKGDIAFQNSGPFLKGMINTSLTKSLIKKNGNLA